MKELPILFNTPMVQAILDGRKTQTRRIISCYLNCYHIDKLLGDWSLSSFDSFENGILKYTYQTEVDNNRRDEIKSPYNKGDRLWVRESWGCCVKAGELKGVWYQASMEDDKNWNRCLEYNHPEWDAINKNWYAIWEKYQDKKRPSIFMPQWASRILLEITDIKVERIQDISEEDAKAEGIKLHIPVPGDGSPMPVLQFKNLWNSINEKRGYGWDINPWVWVISFKVLEVKR